MYISFRKSVMLIIIDKSTNDPQWREELNTKYPIKGFTKVTFSKLNINTIILL